MILLSGHSLAEAGIVREEALSIVLKEREATANLTPESMAGITVNSWLRGNRNPGDGIVWRVKSIQQVYNTRTPAVQLEHVVNTLKDNILFGEITPAVITGNDSATTCTALQAANYILSMTADWTLGTMDSAYQSVTNAYKFDGDNLYDALAKVTETLEEAWWSYDLTVFPFRLNITAKPAGVACELRAGRNLTALSRTIDRTGMYTRFYPIGYDNKHITGEYVSKNESAYGVIAHVETDQTLETEAELIAWANQRLAKHAEPKVSVTADGLELADATGVPLDRLTLGRICRLPLPEFGTVIEERIVELNYQDAVHRPQTVRITMANSQEDVTKILADAIKAGAGPTGAAARENSRRGAADHAWFEDTSTHVAMVAEGIVGVDAQGKPNWTRLSQLIVDGAGIHGDVHSLLDGELYNQTKFDITDDKVSMVVGTNSGGHYIKAGEITLAINNAGESEAHIDANKVYIGNQKSTTVINGKLEATDITAQFINTVYANADLVAGNDIYCSDLTAMGTIESYQMGASIVDCGVITFDSGAHSFSNCIVSASVDSTTGVVTLTYADGTPVTFSRAAPTERVVGTWSGSTYTVASSASGQSLPISATVYQAVEGTANPGTTIYAKTYKNAPTQGNEILTTAMTLTENVANKEVTLTANSLTKGKISTQATWNAGRDSVTITSVTAPAGTTESGTVTATASNSATRTTTISASGGGFSNGGVYAYANLGGVSAARKWISLPETATWSHAWVGTQAIAVTCNVGGKAYNGYFSVGG